MSEKTLLEDVSPEHFFYASDGTVIKNIFELHDRLATMDDSTFQYHVNAEKNDFKNWVRDVLDDTLLATQFEQAKGKEDLIAAVRTRILALTSSKGLSEASPYEETPKMPEHSSRINSGLLDFLGGIALGIIIGLFIAKLLL